MISKAPRHFDMIAVLTGDMTTGDLKAGLWVRHFSTIEELRQALLAFKEQYNQEWLIARLGYRSPAQARQAFALTTAA